MKIHKSIILVLSVCFIVSGIIFSNSLYSQEGNSTGSENEFAGVEIFKPSSGFLVIKNNRMIDRSGIIDVEVFRAYKIYDNTGKLLRKVPASKLSAQNITLPEGVYYVKYKTENGNLVRFGVEIEAGKTTLIE